MNNQNKLIFSFLILLSIFIMFTFSKNLYGTFLENKDTLEVKKLESTEKEAMLKKLEDLNKKIALNNSPEVSELKKYVHEIKEDELIDYFYSYANSSRDWSWFIIIDSINFQKWSKDEYWFMEWSINLNLTVSDEQKMFQVLDFIISKNSSYKFFIDSFSFPNDLEYKWSLQLNLPLRVFYK